MNTRVAVVALAVVLLAVGCNDSAPTAAPGPGGTVGSVAPGSTAAPAAHVDLPPCPVSALASASSPVTIDIWYELSGKVDDTFKKLVAQYNASQSKVVVKIDKQGASYPELRSAYEQAIPAKALPDMAAMEDTTMRFMVDSNTVLPAQSCFDADHLSTDGFVKAAVNHYSVGGVLYPATASLSDLVTYYNKGHFLRAGIDPEAPPKTLAQVRDYAEKIKQAGIADTPVVLKMSSSMIENLLTGERQPVVNNDNGSGPDKTDHGTFDTDQSRSVFAWMHDMVKDGLLLAVPDTDGQVDDYLAVGTQKSSMTLEGSSSATSIKAFLKEDERVPGINPDRIDKKDLDIGVGPLFGVTTPGRGQIGGNAFYIMKNDAHPEKAAAAWDFMKWFNQIDQQVTWFLEGSYLPFLTAATSDPRVQAYYKDDVAGAWLQTADNELTTGVDPEFTGPLIGPYNRFRDAVRRALDSVTTGDADPAAAVTKANAETDAALKEYNDGNF